VSDAVTTLLDAIGLLLVAAGVTLGLWALIDGWALVAGGVVVLAGSQIAEYMNGGE
jgi:hypothetical protein